MFLKLCYALESPRGLVQPQIVGGTHREFNSVGLGWGLVIRIPNKFPDDADDSEPHLENHWLREWAPELPSGLPNLSVHKNYLGRLLKMQFLLPPRMQVQRHRGDWCRRYTLLSWRKADWLTLSRFSWQTPLIMHICLHIIYFYHCTNTLFFVFLKNQNFLNFIIIYANIQFSHTPMTALHPHFREHWTHQVLLKGCSTNWWHQHLLRSYCRDKLTVPAQTSWIRIAGTEAISVSTGSLVILWIINFKNHC